MLEKTLEISALLEVYGALLTEHQREMLRLYYDCDISLFELSEQFGISRQGVRDAIVRGEKQLRQLEDKLGLLQFRTRLGELVASGLAVSDGKAREIFSEMEALVSSEED